MCHRIQFLVKSLKNWKVRLIRLYLYKTSMHSSIKCWKWNGKKSSLEKAKNVQKRHFSWNWIRWRRTDRYWFIILILSSIKDDDKKISFIVICKFALWKKSCSWAKTKHKTDLFFDFFFLVVKDFFVKAMKQFWYQTSFGLLLKCFTPNVQNFRLCRLVVKLF